MYYAMRRNGYSGPFFVALSLLAMGVWVVANPGLFATSSVYEVMGEIAIEAAWGIFMIGTSVSMLISSVNRRPREVAMGALPAAFGYFIIMASVIAGNPRSMFVPLLLVMTLRCLSINREFLARQDDPHLTHPEDD